MRTQVPFRPAARGFTVAEILAALLVLGMALIGIAALYSQSAHTPQQVDPRARAAELAQAMAERIRANTAGEAGYATTIGIDCNPEAQAATAEATAVQETACWQEEIAKTLPNGQGTITRDRSTMPPSIVIAVSWSAPGSGAASYVTRVTLAAPAATTST